MSDSVIAYVIHRYNYSIIEVKGWWQHDGKFQIDADDRVGGWLKLCPSEFMSDNLQEARIKANKIIDRRIEKIKSDIINANRLIRIRELTAKKLLGKKHVITEVVSDVDSSVL